MREYLLEFPIVSPLTSCSLHYISCGSSQNHCGILGVGRGKRNMHVRMHILDDILDLGTSPGINSLLNCNSQLFLDFSYLWPLPCPGLFFLGVNLYPRRVLYLWVEPCSGSIEKGSIKVFVERTELIRDYRPYSSQQTRHHTQDLKIHIQCKRSNIRHFHSDRH